MMDLKIENNTILIENLNDFNSQHILECGQVFRYKKLDNCYEVYSLNHKAIIYSQKVVTIWCDDVKYFIKYFDLDKDYGKIKLALSKDNLLKDAVSFGYGIRILNQDSLETIINFIISANNNMARIKQIIERICESYGTYNADLKFYAFPTLAQLKEIPSTFFRECGAGYRAEYLYETIQMLTNEMLESFKNLNTLELKKELIKLHGVGSKVADCILLYGYYRQDVFPTDTWIKKVYVDSIAKNKSKNYTEPIIRNYFLKRYENLSGYAQQYLFYFKRSTK